MNNLSVRKDSIQAVVLCFFITFIPIFNIPVFWPILVAYFFVGGVL